MGLCADALAPRSMPQQVRKKTEQFDSGHRSIKVMSLYASEVGGFPAVALVVYMPVWAEWEKDGRFYGGIT
jgi:hypothetical protein